MTPLEVLNRYGKPIHHSPSPFHAVQTAQELLEQNNFIELQEDQPWELKKSQGYYCIREHASIIAFKTPSELSTGAQFRIIGSHTDSPCFKLKSNATQFRTDYSLFNIETYGSPLINSWLDRDIQLSGMVIGLKEGELCEKLVELPWTFRIPQLAIHLDRDINTQGLLLNSQEHTYPVAGLHELDQNTWKLKLSEIAQLDEILSWDLCFHDSQKPSLAGMQEELFIAPRLDNLAMLFSSLYALINSSPSASLIPIMASFNHEEVGSSSHEGAGGSFLESTLERIAISNDWERRQLLEALPRSLFMSADMAHALHPNYPNKHDSEHAPQMNQGPVLKTNVNQRYATSSTSAAKIRLLAEQAGVPLQDFQSRNDMGCGSTIGPSSCARLGIPGLDIGNAMLSMHSIRELCGVEDFELMEKLMQKFFEY